MATFTGTGGQDTFVGSTSEQNFFNFNSSTLNFNDLVTGNPNAGVLDFLSITSSGTVFAASFSGVTHVEALELPSGAPAIALSDGMVASSDQGTFTVFDGASASSSLDTAAVGMGRSVVLVAGNGSDTFTGGAGDDFWQSTAADLDASDTFAADGGNNWLTITGGGTVGSAALAGMSGLDIVQLANGGAVALRNGIFGDIAGAFGTAADDTFDASAVTDRGITFLSGTGTDTLIGGSQNDFFHFTGAAELDGADAVAGLAGADTIVFYGGVLAADALTQVTSVELFTLAGGSQFTLTDNVSTTGIVVESSGFTDIVDAHLLAGNALLFYSNGGFDAVRGGAQNDAFWFRTDTLEQDALIGEGGYDYVVLEANADYTAADLQYVSGIEEIQLRSGGIVSVADINVATATGQHLVLSGSAATDVFDATAVSNAAHSVEFRSAGGADVMRGGAGNDGFIVQDGGHAELDGNGGFDRVKLAGLNAGLDLIAVAGATTNIEAVDLRAAGVNQLTLDDPSVTAVTGGGNNLYVIGDANDEVDLGGGWAQVATGVTNPNLPGLTFNHFLKNGVNVFIDDTIPGGNITNANVAPVALDDALTVAEDSGPIVFGLAHLLNNDTDFENHPLNVTAVGAAANGTVVLNGDGTFTFTPDANFNGVATFTYTVDDGQGGSDEGLASVTVTPVPDAPDAADDALTGVAEDSAARTILAATLLANDTDADNLAGPLNGGLTITGVSDPVGGSVALDLNGDVVFTPAANYSGPASFTYTVSDGALTDTATASFAVTPVNDPPVAVDDTLSDVAEDSGVHTILASTLLANDSDPDNLSGPANAGLTVTFVEDAVGGTVALNAGNVEFTPRDNYNGPASFSYMISDGTFNRSATASFTVTPVGDPPIAIDDNPNPLDPVNENSSEPFSPGFLSSVLANDSDPDGAAETAALTVISVRDVLNLPVAVDQTPGVGTVVFGKYGNLTIKADGSYVYAIDNTNSDTDALSDGEIVTDNFVYTASNGPGAANQDDATLAITVRGANDTPSFGLFANPLISETAAVTGSITPHTLNGVRPFFDVDLQDTHSIPTGPILTATWVDSGLADLGPYPNKPLLNNSLTTGLSDGAPLDGAGDITWGFSAADSLFDALGDGETLTLSYALTIADNHGGGAGATFTFQIDGANDVPDTNTGAGVFDEDPSIGIPLDLTGSDPDANDVIASFRILTVPAFGVLTTDPAGLNLPVSPNDIIAATGGTLTLYFHPGADASGATGFTYAAIDPSGAEDASPATTTITINPVNDAPVITAADDGSVGGELVANGGFETGDFSGWSHTGNTGGGGVDAASAHSGSFGGFFGPALSPDFLTQDISVAAGASYALEFWLQNGSSFTPNSFQASWDGTPLVSLTDAAAQAYTQYSFTVTGDGDGSSQLQFAFRHDPHFWRLDDVSVRLTAPDLDDTGTVTFTDVDTGDTHTPGFTPQGASYLGTFSLGALVQAANGGTVDWSFALTPAEYESLAAGTTTQLYDVTITDAPAGTSDSETVTITLTGVNDAPVAVADSGYTVDEEGTLTVTAAAGVLANDTDPDTGDTVTGAVLVSGPANAASFTLNADGSFSYTPTANYSGPDSFTYKANDGTVDSANSVTVSLTVNPVNDAPVITAADDGAVGGHAEPVVNGGFETGDFSGWSHTGNTDDSVVHNGQPHTGTYAALLGPVGSPGFLTQDVAAAAGASYTLTFWLGSPFQGPSNSFQASWDGTPLVSLTDAPAHPYTQYSFTVTGDGDGTSQLQFSFRHAPDFWRLDDVSVRATAPDLDDTGTVTFTDVDTGDTHTAGFTPQAGGYVGTFSLATLVQAANGGTVDWSFALTPAEYTSLPAGTTTQLYDVTITDVPAGTSDSETVTITLTGVNDAPVAVADSGYTVDEDGTLTVTAAAGVLVNDTDPDSGDAVTGAVLVSGPTNAASFTLNPDGSFSYQPDADYTGPDSFSYRANDGTVDSANIATVSITVNPFNDAPTVDASAGAASYTENDTTGVLVDPAITVADVDDTHLEGATITITTNFDSANDLLTFVDQNNITHSYLNGVLTLTGHDTKANYQTALQSIRFQTTGDTPTGATRTVTFTVNDGDADSASDSRDVSVTQVNDPPVNAGPATATTDEDTPLTFSTGTGNAISVSDADVGTDPLLVTLTAQNGTLTLNGPLPGLLTFTTGDGTDDATMKFSGTAAAINAALDGLVFAPAPDYFGDSAGITLITEDQGSTGGGNQTDSDTVIITVASVNDLPVANDDTDSMGENQVKFVDVLANDTDDDGVTDTKSVVALGTILITGPGGPYAPTIEIDPAATANNQIKIDPGTTFDPLGPGETAIITIEYTMEDGAGAQSTATATVTVNGAIENQAPVAGDDTGSTPEDTPLTVLAAAGVLANDTDPDTGNNTGLTVTTDTVTTTQGGSINFASDGSYVYTPFSNFFGIDAVDYTVTDGIDSAQATLIITVNAANDAPVVTASNTAAYTEGGAAAQLSPALTLQDVDDPNLEGATISIGSFVTGDTLNFSNQNNILGNYNSLTGVLTLAGTSSLANYQDALRSITYSSTSTNPTVTNTNLARTVTWTVNDGLVQSLAATTDIDVTGVNVAPVAGNDALDDTDFTQAGNALQKIVIAPGLRANDNDIDNDPLQVILVSGPSEGSVTLNNNGSFTWFPKNGFVRDVSFTYKLSDGALESNVATVTIDVPPPDPLRTASVFEAGLAYFPGTFTLANGNQTINTNAANVPADTNGLNDIYVKVGANFTLVNHIGPGNAPGGPSSAPAGGLSRAFGFTSDGGVEKVWFLSGATDFTLSGTSTTNTSSAQEIFVYNVANGSIERAVTRTDGSEVGALGGQIQDFADISDDGHFLVFQSNQVGLVPQSTVNTQQTFFKDMTTGVLQLVSVTPGGAAGGLFDGGLAHNNGAAISPSGRFVAFSSGATDLTLDDTNGTIQDIYVWDRVAAPSGPAGNLVRFELPTVGNAQLPVFTPDGQALIFQSNGGGSYFAVDLNNWFAI